MNYGMIRRETASSLSQQGESLKKSESMMKDQKYILDKSKRVLRGMTWSGWVTNLMTPDVQKPSDDNTYLGTAEIRSPNVKLIENVEGKFGLFPFKFLNKEGPSIHIQELIVLRYAILLLLL